VTDRQIQLGSVPEEADCTERDQQHGGGQTKMSGVERGKEDPSVVPGENGERTGHQQHPAGALERSPEHPEPNPEILPANAERRLRSLERLASAMEHGLPGDLE
jgi:hypothetical protein